MRKIGLALQFAYYLADKPPIPPTLGDLMDYFNLPKGTAVGERIREARKKGFDIQCVAVSDGRRKRHVYFMPSYERELVREMDGYKAWKRQK